jgi:hypothetical protein
VKQHISYPCAEFSHCCPVSKWSQCHIRAQVMLKIILWHHRLYYCMLLLQRNPLLCFTQNLYHNRVLVCNDTTPNFRFFITKRNLSARWFNKGVPASSCTPTGHVNTIRQAQHFYITTIASHKMDLHYLALFLKHFISVIDDTCTFTAYSIKVC